MRHSRLIKINFIFLVFIEFGFNFKKIFIFIASLNKFGNSTHFYNQFMLFKI